MSTPYPIKIYDTRPDGHSSLGDLPRLGEAELDRLQAFYGFDIDYTYGYERAQPGELFWGLSGFELKAGNAVLQPQVRGLDGDLLTGSAHDIWLILSWPSADALDQGFDPRYCEVGVIGRTEGKGSVGWGFGPEGHIGEDGGYFTVWATSDPDNWPVRRVGSDAVRELGWWDDHIIPNPIFQVMRKEGTQPPASGTEYLANVDASGTITGHIPFVAGPPPAGVAVLGLVRDGQVVAHVSWE